MKQKVNTAFLSYLTDSINGEADDETILEHYADVDPNEEFVIKEIIKSKLLPSYESKPLNFKQKSKLALSFSLSSDLNLGRLFDSNLLPFEHPNDPKLFYIWLWEVLFPNENFKLGELTGYEQIVDLNEPLCLLFEEKQKQR